MALSNGFRVLNAGASISLSWTRAEIYIKDITVATSLTFTNITDTKQMRLIVNNTSGVDAVLTILAPGFTLVNFSDVMTRVRASKTQIYDIVADTTTSKIYFLSPLRLESIYAP